MKARQTLLELVQLRGDVLLKLVIILFLAQIAMARHHTAVKARQSAAGADVRPALKITLTENGRVNLANGRELSMAQLGGEVANLTNRMDQPPVGIYLQATGHVSAQVLYEVFWAVQNAGGSAYVSLRGGGQ